MRILLTVASLDPSFGGPAAKARTLARHLADRGHGVRVVGCATRDALLARNDLDLGHLLPIPVLARYHGTPVPLSLLPVRAAVGQSDLVHILGLRDPVGTAAALAARRRQVPVVLEPVGMHRRRLRSLRLKALFDRLVGDRVVAAARVVVATSPLEREELVADGVPTDRIVVRPNGVDPPAAYQPLPPRGRWRRALGIPEHATVVVAIGRIAAKKGLLHLADACADLDDTHLVIAGPDDGDGTAAALEGRQQPRLHLLLDGVWGEDKRALLADADVAALPSATENFGTAAAEAACAGVPTVVSDQTGVAAWFHPPAHRVVPYGDITALRAAIVELASPAARTAARQAAAELRRTFDWATLAARQEAIYEQVLGR